jgi:hypothetical protein
MSLLDLTDLKEQFDGIWFSYVLVHIPFKLLPEALATLDSVLHPEGSMMILVTVVRESQEKIHNSNVMFDEQGVPRKVPVAHWAPEPLIARVRSRFEISWMNLRPFVDGWAQLSLLVRPRRSPTDHRSIDPVKRHEDSVPARSLSQLELKRFEREGLLTDFQLYSAERAGAIRDALRMCSRTHRPRPAIKRFSRNSGSAFDRHLDRPARL